MRRWYLVSVLCWFLVGCGGDRLEPGPSDPEPSGEEIDDYCEVFGWYGDGHCDEVCPQPDPDCAPDPEPAPGPSPVPEPPEPEECVGEDVGWAREYVQYGSCASVDLDCESWEGNWVAFADECGCGCEEAQNTGEPPPEPLPDPTTACLDDSNPDVDRIGDLDECALIDFDCSETYVPFYDDCGCGCRLSCSDDFECPNGYCGEDPSPDADEWPRVCIYPECGDGSELACRMSRPDCYDTDVAAVVNGCWECLDARTCGPSNGP